MSISLTFATVLRAPLAGLITVIVMLVPLSAQAVMSIKIIKGEQGAEPIAVVPFGFTGAGSVSTRLGQIVADDLTRTGRFEPIPFVDLPSRPATADQVNFRDWRLLQTPNLVIGNVQALASGRYLIEFRLYDVFRAEQLTGFKLEASTQDLRRTAHQIADIIYERLTGERGVFDTTIAYVTEVRTGSNQRKYTLNVADSDGYNSRAVLESREPVMSPAWSPDGQRLAYVSFEGQRPRIFVQNLATGKRAVISAFPGLNNAPAFSPDGTRLALTLSKDGNPEIYVLYLDSKRLQRITDSPAIDTEPAWSPDGELIAFTSDRGGRAQVYQIPAGGGRAERVTFEGIYNSRPAYSPDGTQLAMVHSNGNGFKIGVLDLANNAFRVLTETSLDESPTFAPNGEMILYATVDGGRATLAAVATDGRMRQQIGVQQGQVREPSWSPFKK